MLYHTTWLILKLDPLKYMMELTAFNGRMARWQILLSEFDIVYINQKTIKGSTIAKFLANRASEDYEPLSFDFPNEDLMYVATTKECPWKLNFDGALNAVGNGIGAILASMIKVKKPEDMRPIQMSIFKIPAYFYNLEEKERDDHPWYHDVLRYVKNHEYSEHATENDRRTLRRLASDYFLDGDILYKRRKHQVLLRCVDAVEARKILEEVDEGVCGTDANGFAMARQIMRFGYYWSTMEGDCINYAKNAINVRFMERKFTYHLHHCML
ncbi:polygalacturonase-like [Gossypium australe]|uniref:Polygalacturonase-like n=1 Tax=Gossypium australe TaxID=47621 RepID=A0A5B6UXS7_9ROSI|nr:polygalacturonase-like [Gossypium australe]